MASVNHQVKGILVSKRIKKYLDDERREGIIHSIFNNAINLLFEEDTLITLHNKPEFVHPFSVVVPVKDFTKFCLARGETVRTLPMEINCRALRIRLNGIRVWDSRPIIETTYLSKDAIQNNINLIKHFLLSNPHARFGLAGVLNKENNSTFIATASRIIDDISSGIRENNPDKMVDSCRKIIGLGIGLTPSGDDFLAGLMTTLVYIAPIVGNSIFDTIKLNKSLIGYNTGETSFISYQFLKFACLGEVAWALHKLIRTMIFQGEEDLANVYKVAAKFGSTSGCDTMVGIIKALEGSLYLLV